MSSLNVEDPFWSLATRHNDEESYDEEAALFPCAYSKTFSIKSKRRSSPDSRGAPLTKEGLKIYLGEMKEEGCMGDIGGVMWEASILLCCFILSHQEEFITSSVVELGAGVGLPGLLTTVLKRNYLDFINHLTSSVAVGQVILTDFDFDVLTNLEHNVIEQFKLFYHPNCLSEVCSLPDVHNSAEVRVTVRRLDWTDTEYSEVELDENTESVSCCAKVDTATDSQGKRGKDVCDLLIGSELIYMSSLASLANVIM